MLLQQIFCSEIASIDSDLPQSPDKGPMGHTKFTTSGAHDVIAIRSPQNNDLCTEELRDRAQVMKLPGHWTRSVYHLEGL